MKAAVVCANEDVQYLDYEEPTPGPGEVKVKVKCSGICGSDIPRVLHNGVHFYPIVLGHEFSGDVVEVGEGVTKVKVGDHVSGAPLKPCMKCDDCQNGNFSLCKHYSFIGSRQQGSNADYVVVPEQNAVPFDKTVPYEQGAMFEPATVAIHGVFQNDYHGGESVPKKLLYSISVMNVLHLQNVLVQMKSSIQKKKDIWKKPWISQAEKDMVSYLRQPDRFPPCIWHLSLRQTRHMYASLVLLMKTLPLHRRSGRT